MQSIYVATIIAAHDFDQLVATKAFASRVTASLWAKEKKAELVQRANAGEAWDGYDFRSEVEAIDFDPTEVPFNG